MPPKHKFTKEEIINAALDITRREGIAAVTARAVGAKLNSSSKVIFSLFQHMEELQRETVKAAYERYQRYLREDVESGRYPPYKAIGMAYIRFAQEETELFKLLFMCDRSAVEKTSGEDKETAITLIMKANNFTREQAELLHLEMWICVHGIATMIATSYYPLEWELISRMVTDVYQGIRTRMITGGGS